MTAHDDRARDEQPAPAAREIPADELAAMPPLWWNPQGREVLGQRRNGTWRALIADTFGDGRWWTGDLPEHTELPAGVVPLGPVEQPAPAARERLADVLRGTWHGEQVGSTDQHEWNAVASYVLQHFVSVGTVPAGDEIPADELADAERIARTIAERKVWHSSAPPADRMAALMAEYDERGRKLLRRQLDAEDRELAALQEVDDLRTQLDERGRERDAARAELKRLRDALAASESARLGLDYDLGAAQHERDAARAEVEAAWAASKQIEEWWKADRAELERLHTWAGLLSLLDEHYPADVVTGESGDLGPRIVALTREVERLRARDEKAAAVVRAWWGRRGVFEQGTELWAALDALARASEHEGVGR